MSLHIAESIRGRCHVIAVSDAYKLAPWADALVSQDRPWWNYHRPEFAGRKFSGGNQAIEGVARARIAPCWPAMWRSRFLARNGCY